MKKTLLPLLFLPIFGLLLAACEKPRDWTCSCNVGGKADTTLLTNQKEDDARKVCDGVVNTAHTNRIAADCTLTEKK